MTLNEVTSLLSNTKFLFGMSLVVLFVVLCTTLYKLDKSAKTQYVFVDMFLENGKASSTKFAQFIALALSSWGFIALVLTDKLTEAYFGLYMATWALNRGVTKFLEAKDKITTPTKD